MSLLQQFYADGDLVVEDGWFVPGWETGQTIPKGQKAWVLHHPHRDGFVRYPLRPADAEQVIIHSLRELAYCPN